MTSAKEESWLKAVDLVQSTCTIQVKNNTSKMDIRSGKEIELVEMSKNSISLKLPRNSCAISHLLSIKIEKNKSCPLKTIPPLTRKDFEVLVTCKVTEIEKFDDEYCVVGLVFYQADQNKWLQFLYLQGMRQGEIDSIVTNIKD
jgi:hypothetical protein